MDSEQQLPSTDDLIPLSNHIQANFAEAESVLASLNEEKEASELEAILKHYEEVRADTSEKLVIFEHWEKETLPAHLKSHVLRSLSLLSRQANTSKHIVRNCREKLGIPDPERQMEEMNLRMMMGQHGIFGE